MTKDNRHIYGKIALPCVIYVLAVIAIIAVSIWGRSAEPVPDTPTGGAGRDISRQISTETTEAVDDTTETAEIETTEETTAEETDMGEWLTVAETETETVASPDAILIAKTIGVEAPHCPTMEQVAVAWCVLNRVDDPRFPSTIYEVLTAPYQFAYFPGTALRDDLYELALDVLARWERERAGETDVGRVLPREYVYYDGDLIAHNYFRIVERVGAPWDWSLPNPYA